MALALRYVLLWEVSIHCQIERGSISQTGTFGHFLIISESLVTHKNLQGLCDIYLSLCMNNIFKILHFIYYKSNLLSETNISCPV